MKIIIKIIYLKVVTLKVKINIILKSYLKIQKYLKNNPNLMNL